MHSNHLWLNGRLVPFAEATLHFLTPALHYGVAVFEGIRCYRTSRGPAVFRLREHLDRFEKSARVMGWDGLPYGLDELEDASKQVVRANGFDSCYIRPLAYLADGGWNLNLGGTTLAVGIAAWPWNAYLGEQALKHGVRANISSYTRHHANVTMTKAKIAGNYVNSFLAKTESVRLGYDEAIMLDPQGYVAECTGENVFVVRGSKLYTSPAAAILEGITRDSLIQLARGLGYEIVEQPVSRDQLYVADEVFVCGTAAEVVGLREIDGRTIGSGKTGPVTASLQKEYSAVVRGDHERSAEWLDWVGVGSQVAAPTQQREEPASGANDAAAETGTARKRDVAKTA